MKEIREIGIGIQNYFEKLKKILKNAKINIQLSQLCLFYFGETR